MFESAFGLREVAGGALGAYVASNQEGLFSNEAGWVVPLLLVRLQMSVIPFKQGLNQSLGVFYRYACHL
nr:alanine:cation symporter family protein [Bacillus sp. BA3]